ncbi:2-oxo-4-hydroxy-4-carboxy-5-ureidoimidazoline decarboxylase [Hoyosella sp. G463]|uniref:2-oxo-4-hydroxy-4-carboxy-5-ureidoimidazoline decarboxylase n=2 Tax=Lolliginicoccus lacisalsi TaxID=2742202 RepID=A0A927PLR6_9ACTN|nr:2-oxo-4-hydroxy-4-carboxy-5-ureidoimidazoline decarboxylase [Lolliginicoccus lacisalsi]MBD8507138.1 2-oxo-4-hydroxy-4-carboxy-5-ureidoimidazoline decarboxylase [Lolliginicoccus lacisalsi]
MSLAAFNDADQDDAVRFLAQACEAPHWARRVAALRPFATVDELCEQAAAELAATDDADIRAGLAGHPRIGEPVGEGRSATEQSRVAAADDAARARLVEANRAYEERFGHVYLVFAHGRGAEELLAILEQRLGNDPDVEWRVARTELCRITEFRLAAMVEAES